MLLNSSDFVIVTPVGLLIKKLLMKIARSVCGLVRQDSGYLKLSIAGRLEHTCGTGTVVNRQQQDLNQRAGFNYNEDKTRITHT